MTTHPHPPEASRGEFETCYLQFGLRVRQIREALGLTQDDLRKRVNMSSGSIANIETGKQRILLDDVQKFSNALGCTPKHLLRGIYT